MLQKNVWLAPRSCAVLRGEARYVWQHGIASRRTDCLEEGVPLPRGRRVSLTPARPDGSPAPAPGPHTATRRTRRRTRCRRGWPRHQGRASAASQRRRPACCSMREMMRPQQAQALPQQRVEIFVYNCPIFLSSLL